MRTSERIREELIKVERYLNTHTSDSEGWWQYFDERRSRLLKKLQAAQMREWNL